MNLENLLDKLKQGEEFSLGDPWRFSDKAVGIVVPILRASQPKRGYVLLEEVKDKLEILDSGSIDKLIVKGDVDSPVFFRGGSMLQGKGTQSRAVQYGVVVIPTKREVIPVMCIHASHPISPHAFFAYAGPAPRSVYKALSFRRSQSEVWGAASMYAANALTHTPSLSAPMDDLVSVVRQTERFKGDVEELVKRIPATLVNQVGVAILDLKGTVGIELFDCTESWKAFADSLIKNYSDILTKEQEIDIFEPNMEKIALNIFAFLEKARQTQAEEVYNKDNSTTYLLKGEVFGEYTALNGSVIHLVLTRKEPEEERKPTDERLRLLRFRRTYPPQTGQRESREEERREETAPAFLYTTTSPTRLTKPAFKKGSFEFLKALEYPKTWTEIKKDWGMSTRTLMKRARELQDEGFVKRITRVNGKTTYTLTERGRKVALSADELPSSS